MTETIKTFDTMNGIARRLDLNIHTVEARMRKHAIQPDGVVRNGARAPILIFDVTRLSDLRKTLCPKIS
jgi:hypothetical protein